MADRILPQAFVKLLEREGTGISWADLTMNFWIGCQEVSPACDHCYAREFVNARVNAAREAVGKPAIVWGPGGAREQTTPANRKKPLRWNRIAADAGVRLRVFCSSLSDWADKHVPDEWRAEIADTIRATPWLDWMLLTKRIGNAHDMLTQMFPEGVPQNVWIGITVCNAEEWRRDVPKLRALKFIHEFPIAFVSVEPLLGALPQEIGSDFYHECDNWRDDQGYAPSMDPSTGQYECCSKCDYSGVSDERAIDLIIVGGESGKGARPIHPDWVRQIRDACAQNGVTFHFKQWGEYLPVFDRDVEDPDWRDCARWQHERPKGKWHNLAGGTGFHGDRVVYVDRVGVRKAGHLLDGREHREMPAHG